MNVSQKTDRMGGEISAWFAANGADLVFAVLAGLFVMALLWALRAFGHRLVRDRSEDQKWRNLVGRMLAKTGSLFIILCGLEIVAELTRLPRTADRAIDILFTIAAVLQGAVWARALILGLLTNRIGEAEQTSTFGTAFSLIRGLVSVALFLIALVLILDNLGVNVTGLVAGLGIGGVAIGLAAQGIFKDLFAALAIILDKPFRRGETIKFDAFTGTVEQIGLKSTRLRSVEGEEIVISNAILLDKVMLNFAAIQQRRILLRFGLVYQTDPAMIAGLNGLVGTVAGRHPHLAFVRAGPIGIGPHAIDCEAEMRFESAEFDLFFRTRAAVIAELLEALNEAGLRLAYPSQTSFTAAPDGRHVLPWGEPDPRKGDVVQP
jgi:small-conductance mechanosensitive channel